MASIGLGFGGVNDRGDRPGRVGPERPIGPCSVETPEQTLETARAVKAAGAKILRGGAFKPRTSPYEFRGLGEEGLKILVEAREETGMPIITEVLTPSDVDLVGQYTLGAEALTFGLEDDPAGVPDLHPEKPRDDTLQLSGRDLAGAAAAVGVGGQTV